MGVDTNNHVRSTIALASLDQVHDPEIGLSVVDLGLIYSLQFDDVARKVECTMTLTTEFCPMGETIVAGVKEALERTCMGDSITVKLTFEPPWNPDMISGEGKEFLSR